MKIIVGLGNPGKKYVLNRHNVGFLILDQLINHWQLKFSSKLYDAEIYSGFFGNIPIMLAKPQTWMNLSGKSVGPLFHFYHCRPEDLIVIHDDLDLPPMTLRLKQGGGTGGHRGLKSIHEHLGKEKLNYYRVRIGIGHPANLEHVLSSSVEHYVLSNFSQTELKTLEHLFPKILGSVEDLLQESIQKAMNQYHRS